MEYVFIKRSFGYFKESASLTLDAAQIITADETLHELNLLIP